MRSLLLRVLLLSSALAAGYAGSTYTHFEPEIREARAQELAPTPDPATATPTATATQVPTPVPTATAPSPTATATATVDASPTPLASTATAIATGVATATETASPTVTATAILTTTPTPTAPLPPLADITDPTGTNVKAVIDAVGGRISSPDGRVVIDFPPAALSEPVEITITRLTPTHPWPAHPDTEFVSRWQFDAAAINRGGARVERFDAPLTFHFRFEKDEFPPNLDPATLAFWTLDKTTGTWTRLQSDVDVKQLHLTGQADHFSEDAITANKVVSTAPLLNGKNVGMQGLSSELSSSHRFHVIRSVLRQRKTQRECRAAGWVPATLLGLALIRAAAFTMDVVGIC